jgi:hypothetical protein
MGATVMGQDKLWRECSGNHSWLGGRQTMGTEIPFLNSLTVTTKAKENYNAGWGK